MQGANLQAKCQTEIGLGALLLGRRTLSTYSLVGADGAEPRRELTPALHANIPCSEPTSDSSHIS